MEASICWDCALGYHDTCLMPHYDDDQVLRCCCPVEGQLTSSGKEKIDTVIGRPLSNPEDMKDVLSTGRKRAAVLYPITNGMVCEWAGLKFAGGGVEPIIGCKGNLLYEERGKYSRHHGPNKSVIDNAPGNVHRICEYCHNRWHAANNEFYGKDRPEAGQPWYPSGEWLPHDPVTKATKQEIEENEEYWAKRKLDRVDTRD